MEEKLNRLVAIDNGDSKVARSLTNKPPAHYTLKIDSFWLLYKTMLDAHAESYESEVFEAGGYKWKLSLYPNGDKGNKGKGYISIYLIIVDPQNMPQDWEVTANLRFFVYDHFQNKYLTVQDANAKANKFDEKNTGFGFARLLPFSTFVYSGNGYLVSSKCKFGVEVLVHNYEGMDRCNRTVDTLAWVNAPYTWKIKMFSAHTKEFYPSKVFTVGNRKWKLKLYPNGVPSEKNTMLSIFLEADDLDIFPEQKTFLKFDMCIVNQLGRNDMNIQSRGCCFSKTSSCLGYAALFPLEDLHDASKGFVVNDTLILKANVYVFSAARTFSKTTHIPAPNAEVKSQGLKRIAVMNFSRMFSTNVLQAMVKKVGATETQGKSSCSSEKTGVEAPKAIQSRKPWWFF